jgi:hypothetical protein
MTLQTLISRDELRTLPKLYETENVEVENKLLCIKLFISSSMWTWYVIESDGSDECFGLVVGSETEFGYFSIKELSSLTDPFGRLIVERDEYFVPTLVKEVL